MVNCCFLFLEGPGCVCVCGGGGGGGGGDSSKGSPVRASNSAAPTGMDVPPYRYLNITEKEREITKPTSVAQNFQRRNFQCFSFRSADG